jgi:hypothetical protein
MGLSEHTSQLSGASGKQRSFGGRILSYRRAKGRSTVGVWNSVGCAGTALIVIS